MALEVYRPVAPESGRRLHLARRLRSLHGARVGLLGNLKPNCDVLLHTAEDIMVDCHGIAATVFREKSSCSIGAPVEMLDELASTCDAAIVALGD